MTFAIKIDEDALVFIKQLPDKSHEIIDGKIKTLKDDPYPGKRGDKELRNPGKGKKVYRLHIGHSYGSVTYFAETTHSGLPHDHK